MQIWMSVRKDCTTASLEGCCARTSSAPSCASAPQECNAGLMERAAQVPRMGSLWGQRSSSSRHCLCGFILCPSTQQLLLGASHVSERPLCPTRCLHTQNFCSSLVCTVPAQDDTALCHVPFLLSFPVSVSSFFALSCFWKGQSAPRPAAWPLADGECAKQRSHPALGQVQGKWTWF